MKKEFQTYSPEETENIAYEFALTIDNGKSEFIAMYGDLGVGKTAFVRGIARALAPNARVKSPTFTIVNEYKGGKAPLYHFDVYVQNGICVVEWSENIPDSIPSDAYKITIERVSDNVNARKITIER